MNLEPDPTRQVYYTSNSLPTFVQHNNMELCERFIKYKFVLKSDAMDTISMQHSQHFLFLLAQLY